MDIVRQFLVETPLWAWALLGYLIFKGVKARRPGDTTLVTMSMIPVVFTVWGLYDLLTLYGVTPTGAFWLAGIAAGSAVGWFIASRFDIVADRAMGVLHRPADFSLLPLLLATFAIKYSFGVISAVAPQLLTQTGFQIADLTLSGLFTGIFVGKFVRYAWIWRQAGLSLKGGRVRTLG